MTWISYNTISGTITEKSEKTIPAKPGETVIQTSYNFPPSQPTYFYRFDGTNVVENNEADISVHDPEPSTELSGTSDLPIAINGIIKFLPRIYLLKTDIDIGTNHIEVSDGTVIVGIHNSITIKSTSYGCIKGTNCSLSISNVTVDSPKAFDVTDDRSHFCTIKNVTIKNQQMESDILNLYYLNLVGCMFVNNKGCVKLDNIEYLSTTNNNFLDTNTGSFIRLTSGSYEGVSISGNNFDVLSGNIGLEISEGNITVSEGISILNNMFIGSSTSFTNGFNVFSSGIISSGNTGIDNNEKAPTINNADMFNITSPHKGLLLYNTDLNAIVYHNTDTWKQLVDIDVYFPIIKDDFSIGTLTGSNWGTANDTKNKWVIAPNSGGVGNSLHISNDGSSQKYSSIPNVSHAWIDVSIPNIAVNSQLILKWFCEGEDGEDFVTIRNIDTSVVPIAGTKLSQQIIGRKEYFDESNEVVDIIDLDPSTYGTTRRICFSWENDDGGNEDPPFVLVEFEVKYKI